MICWNYSDWPLYFSIVINVQKKIFITYYFLRCCLDRVTSSFAPRPQSTSFSYTYLCRFHFFSLESLTKTRRLPASLSTKAFGRKRACLDFYTDFNMQRHCFGGVVHCGLSAQSSQSWPQKFVLEMNQRGLSCSKSKGQCYSECWCIKCSCLALWKHPETVIVCMYADWLLCKTVH